MKELVKPLGIVKKIIRIIREVSRFGLVGNTPGLW